MDEQKTPQTDNDQAAANYIRHKIDELYQTEPNAKTEEQEIKTLGVTSKHQQFMANLGSSGKSFAEIQAAWHEYYQSQPDDQKHAIWREFYENQSKVSHFRPVQPMHQSSPVHLQTNKHSLVDPSADLALAPARKSQRSEAGSFFRPPKAKLSTYSDIKRKLAAKVSANGKLKPKDHLKSLFFGLSLGGITLLFLLFVAFNQLVVGPFITPSRVAGSSPIITDPTNTAVSPESRVIIPKISVDALLVTDAHDDSEKTIQSELEKGVVLYPYTGLPGQNANPVIFGHSSNNLFNKGQYKFIFVSLNKLESGDTFMVNYAGVQYTYKVFNKKIVTPNEVGVLVEHPKAAMLTLITCDPPGTNTNRLIIQGEQINPDPNSNVAATNVNPIDTKSLPGSPESLLKRIWNAIF